MARTPHTHHKHPAPTYQLRTVTPYKPTYHPRHPKLCMHPAYTSTHTLHIPHTPCTHPTHTRIPHTYPVTPYTRTYARLAPIGRVVPCVTDALVTSWIVSAEGIHWTHTSGESWLAFVDVWDDRSGG